MSDDNVIVPFQIENSGLRGRSVRLGAVLDDILAAHDYPYPVAHLVAECVCQTILLASMIKYEGIFTLQARGDGPIQMLVADVTSDGDVRACAHFDKERLTIAREALAALKTPEGSANHLAQYLGTGTMAFTVDQDGPEGRYQGIVPLEGSSFADCVRFYFKQSEQIDTAVKMSAGLRDGKWRAGGIMLQRMPEDDGRGERLASNIAEDDWRRSMVFLDSAQDDELLSPELTAQDLLFRLFHEDGVRVYDPRGLQKKCRCSAGRVQRVVKTLSQDDVDYLIKDGRIEARCEFCNALYALDPVTYEELP